MGFVLYNRVDRALFRSFDSELLSYINSLAMVSHIDEKGQYELDFADELMGEFSGNDARAFFAIFRMSDSHEMECSRSLQSFSFQLPFALEGCTIHEPKLWNTKINQRPVRFMAFRKAVLHEQEENGEEKSNLGELSVSGQFDQRPPVAVHDYLFVVGVDRRRMDERLGEIALLLCIFLGSGLFLLLIASGVVVSKGLKPLRVLEEEVRVISPSHLIPVSVFSVSELEPISRTLNAVISDLKEAFERERRFTADVAHELRTPISEIRTAAEVALNDPTSLGPSGKSAMEDVLGSSIKMQKVVQTLLTLARYDSGQLRTQVDSISLESFLLTIWREFQEKFASRQITVQFRIPVNFLFSSDRNLLETVFCNLFENAVAYTPTGGTVEWRAALENGRFSFSISNTVSNLAPEDIPHLCDRFWQKDPARSTNTDRCGLGLSLVRSIADTLNLNMQIRLSDSNRLEIFLLSQHAC